MRHNGEHAVFLSQFKWIMVITCDILKGSWEFPFGRQCHPYFLVVSADNLFFSDTEGNAGSYGVNDFGDFFSITLHQSD